MNRFWQFLYQTFILYPNIDREKTPPQAPEVILKAPKTMVFPPTQIMYEDPSHAFIFEKNELVAAGASFSQFAEVRELIINTPRHEYSVCPCGRCLRIRAIAARLIPTLLDIAEASQVLFTTKRIAEIHL